jgi:hypothetical protein
VNNSTLTYQTRIKDKIKVKALQYKINTLKDASTKFNDSVTFPNTIKNKLEAHEG